MTLSIAGGRESNNSFLLHGIETRNAPFGSAAIRPSIEAIQEFKIQRSTFGAEFGRSAAVINTTLRPGANDLHDSVLPRRRSIWFFNYEALRQRIGSSATGLYPSEAQLRGNLADDSAGAGILPRSRPLCQGAPANSRKRQDVIDPSSGLAFPGSWSYG
jgi:hypothetical protein